MKTVDAFIETLPEEKAKLAALLREIILSSVPGIQEKLSFKIPFYHYFGMFCYINPTKEGIDLGLCRGKDLVEEFPRLHLKNRAIVATLPISHVKDFEQLRVRELITAAAVWNEEAKRMKIPIVKKPAGRKNKKPGR
jgi:hypothetical protein